MEQTLDEFDDQKMILKAFSDYLVDENKDFVYSDKFGLLYISAWSIDRDAPYEVIRIKSTAHLLEVLAQMLVFDCLAERAQICFTKDEARILYGTCIQQYAAKLTGYENELNKKLERVIGEYTCVNE